MRLSMFFPWAFSPSSCTASKTAIKAPYGPFLVSGSGRIGTGGSSILCCLATCGAEGPSWKLRGILIKLTWTGSCGGRPRNCVSTAFLGLGSPRKFRGKTRFCGQIFNRRRFPNPGLTSLNTWEPLTSHPGMAAAGAKAMLVVPYVTAGGKRFYRIYPPASE